LGCLMMIWEAVDLMMTIINPIREKKTA
jgi:hypothetical protein